MIWLGKKHLHTLLLITLPLITLSAQNLRYNPAVLDNALQETFENSPTEYVRAYILLADQVNLQALNQEFVSLRASRQERAVRVVGDLKNKALNTQLPWLKKLRNSPAVKANSIESYWITNMILVEAQADYLATLSKDPSVIRIEKELQETLLEDKGKENYEFDFQPGSREKELTAMNVHKLWELGYTGYGTRVMVVDTDIDFNHRALKTQFAYQNEPLEEVFTGEIAGQICFSHGTNVVGLIVGLDRLNDDTIGVAFNAKYLNGPVPFFDGEGNQCKLEGRTLNSLGNLQFALDPDGNSNTTKDIPDVINNSYGTTIFNSNDCFNSAFRNAFQALDAAGVSVIFAAGNEGPGAGSLTVQASYNFDELVPFVVGSVDDKKIIADFSSRGPTQCIDGPDKFKPEIVAPGVNVRTTKPFNNFDEVPGTSFSTPYVSGVILLLREAFPNLSHRIILRSLLESAQDLGVEGEDNVYGNGLVDAFAAYNWLIEQGHIPNPPRSTANDAIVLDMDTRNLDCGREVRVFLTVANNGMEPITEMEIDFIRADDNNTLGTVNWQGEIAPGAQLTFETDPFNALIGSYTLQAFVKSVNGAADLRNLDNVMKADVVVSQIPIEPEITIAGENICRDGQSLLTATSSLGGTIRWYDAFEGGNIVAEGSSVFLENVQRDTTLYVSVANPDKVGLETADIGPNTFLSQQAGLVFDAQANFTLKTVKVFAEAVGPRIIQLKDDRGNVQQKVIPISSVGENILNLDFEVQPGEDYQLLMTLGNGLAVTTNQTGYPHEVDGIVRINRATGTVSSFYPYFYDWGIEYDYVCGRVLANIKVNEEGTAPLVDFATDVEVVQLDASGEAVVNFTDLSEGLVDWKWTFGTNGFAVQQDPVYIFRAPGLVTVTLYGTDSLGCSSMTMKTIEVLDAVTSTAEQKELDNQITLFPNPASEQVNVLVGFEKSQSLEYTILDLLGRVQQQGNLGKIEAGTTSLDIKDLPAGTYFIQFKAGQTRIGKRLVKY